MENQKSNENGGDCSPLPSPVGWAPRSGILYRYFVKEDGVSRYLLIRATDLPTAVEKIVGLHPSGELVWVGREAQESKSKTISLTHPCAPDGSGIKQNDAN